MSGISLKLSDELLAESSRNAHRLRMSRSAYIRNAIEKANREAAARFRAERLARASRAVRGESMKVNAEFAAFERGPEE